jgi:hypothetical protein
MHVNPAVAVAGVPGSREAVIAAAISTHVLARYSPAVGERLVHKPLVLELVPARAQAVQARAVQTLRKGERRGHVGWASSFVSLVLAASRQLHQYPQWRQLTPAHSQ